MAEETNVQAPESVEEQEETTTHEETGSDEESSTEDSKEDTVVLSKKEFTSMQRKAIAYDATKGSPDKAPKVQPNINNTNNADPHYSDELKLIARGFSDEEIDQAKVVAKGKGVKLTDAIKDPLFTSFQTTWKESKRKEQAKLGAARGSGESKPEDKSFKAGSSRDEHKAAWKKMMGQ
jgi:hypothetical protein